MIKDSFQLSSSNTIEKEALEKLKKENQDLRYFNQLYEEVLEASDIGVWELNLIENSLYWSEMVYKIHEVSKDTKINLQDAIIFYHPDYRDQIAKDVDSAINEFKKWDHELKLITAKKNIIWVRAMGFPIVEDGKVIKIRGIFQDINALKSQEEKLRENEERYRLTLEHSAIGIALVRLDGSWLSVNPALCDLTGYSEEELLKIDFQTITHPDDLDADLNYLEQLLAGEINTYEMEKRYFHKSGKIIWIQLNVTLVRDKSGEPLYFISQIQDFTARKKYQAQLIESESKFRSTFDYALIGIVTIDLDGNYLSVNPAFCKMLLYTKEELLKLDIKTVTHPKDIQEELEYLKKITNREIDHFTTEKRFQRKDGTSLWTEINVSSVLDKDNNIKYFVKHVQDITERRELNEVLEMKVKKRTRQLESVNQELQAFSYSVSHDLRSPLRTIHGFCQALQEDYAEELPDKAKNYLNRVSAASVRMGNLIDDLLILSRISRRELNIKKIDLTALVKQVVEDRPEKVNAQFIIHEDMTLDGDEGLFFIVMENLIGNSLKYADKNKDKAIIEVGGKKDEELGNIYFVKDNGVGFDMQYADKLFGAFQRLHSSHEFEGTGIGLATVKRIINRHGGKIWAESQLGIGTTFYFTVGANKPGIETTL